jgi:hypothetical protein
MTRSASWAVGFLFGVLYHASVAADTPFTHDELAGKPALKANADQLSRTVIVPTLESAIPPNTNVIWCNTFQLAWHELRSLLDEAGMARYASPTITQLNRSHASKNDLDESSYVAAAGSGPDFIRRVRRELEEKFKGHASSQLLPDMTGNMPCAFSYLFKALPFRWAFHRFETPLDFGGRRVESWGISQLLNFDKAEIRQSSQIYVHEYTGPERFILELKVLSDGDQLILARVAARSTIQETIAGIRQRISEDVRPGLHELEDLQVPVFNFEVLRQFHEVCPPLADATQVVRFRLDERGAILRSEAIAASALPQRRFIFDGPFCVLLQRRNSRQPYFFLWAANSELMVPFGESTTDSASDRSPSDGWRAVRRPTPESVPLLPFRARKTRRPS